VEEQFREIFGNGDGAQSSMFRYPGPGGKYWQRNKKEGAAIQRENHWRGLGWVEDNRDTRSQTQEEGLD